MKNDLTILKIIYEHCTDIFDAVKRFGNDYTVFAHDKHYRNAISMSLLQIGELTGKLSVEFQESTKTIIPWVQIKGMRNLFAHNYGAMDIQKIWETVMFDIPILNEFCVNQIKKRSDD